MTLLSSRQCDAGLRRRTYCILSGSVLTVWPEVEKQIPSIQSHKLQIVRLKTDDGKKYIGPMVPPFLVTEVRHCLQQMANGGGPGAASTSASTASTSTTSTSSSVASAADKK
ncbi:Protein strawberry notch 2 [Tyrophagus putrescentiae]|nr:Protein strawberry notch 2 [Tyrophagus putrescentiae]